MPSLANLDQLAPELYNSIIDYIPEDLVSQTVLSLTRALPRATIPLDRLFRHVRLDGPERVVQFYVRIRGDEIGCGYVRTFSLETWQADADVVANIVPLLRNLGELRLFIGPNFSPEHLEEIFTHPKQGLELMSLRFRPYVQRATYYQFLAGAYFDSVLIALSRWPVSTPPKLSIIQDLLDSIIPSTNRFAQPFVFHSLEPFSALCRAPSVFNLPYFRVRIPSRQISKFIYTPRRSFPLLRLLDMSTCDVRINDVESVLGRFGMLEHLILDRCNLVTQRDVEGAQESQWAILGKTMALAGVVRARAREKKLKVWLEAATKAAAVKEAQEADQKQQTTEKVRRGRRGLATATISLRESAQPNEEIMNIPQTALLHGFKPKDKLRVLPPKPGLLSISTSLPAHANVAPEAKEGFLLEFQKGWAQGVATLVAIRLRLKTSWYNGTAKVVLFDDLSTGGGSASGPEENRTRDEEYGLCGLRLMEDEESFGLGMEADRCPLLCFAGSAAKTEDHAANCGHRIGWEVWKDDL